MRGHYFSSSYHGGGDDDAGKNARVDVGENHVVITRSGRSSPLVVGILGKFTDESGKIERIVLDQIAHKPGDSRLGQWSCWGVVTTELTPYEERASVVRDPYDEL